MIRAFRAADLELVLDVWQAASAVGHPFLTDEFLASERQTIAFHHLPSAETWVWEAERYGFIESARDVHEATGLELIRMELPAIDFASGPPLGE